MIHILIADDHPVVRAGLIHIIAPEIDMTVTGEAANGVEVLKLLHDNTYHLLLLDISMPGESGMDILKQVHCSFPKLKVLMLSNHPEELYAERAIKAGADGYLNKQFAPKELVFAIRKIIHGGKYISPTAAETLAFKHMSRGDQLPHERLSDRELQVLSLIGSGKTISEISRELLLSVKTISTYRARILVKMGLSTTSQLIKYAIDNQI